MKRPLLQQSIRRLTRLRGFTLVEIMVSAALGGLVLAAAASIIVMTTRTVYKNTMVDDAVSSTRKIQEHLNKEISVAVSQSTPIRVQPVFSDPSSTTPVRYGTIVYRVTIGSYASVYTATLKTSNSIVLDCPADLQPAIGDYLMMDSPLLGSAGPPIVGGAMITAVDDHRSGGAAGTVTLTLGSSIDAATYGTAHVDVDAGTIVSIQRERKYQTVAPGTAPVAAGSPITGLHWYSSTAAGTPYLVLSTNVDAGDRYLFSQIPEDTAALEPSVSWRFRYLTAETNRYLPGSKPSYYQANYAEGLLMPKSGNPLNVSSYAGITTSTSTTTTTSTSTSTSTTSTSVPTSISTSSTTSVATSSVATSSTSVVTSSSTSVVTSSSTSVATSSSSVVTTSVTTSVPISSTTSIATSSTSIATTTSVSTSSTSIATTTSVSTTSSSISTTTSSIVFDG